MRIDGRAGDLGGWYNHHYHHTLCEREIVAKTTGQNGSV